MMKCIKKSKNGWEETKLVVLKQMCYIKEKDSKDVYEQVGKSSTSAKLFGE